MVAGLFAYILKYSKRQQMVLMALIVCSFPFYYFSLDLPKTIINDAITGSNFPVDLSIAFAGYSIGLGDISQIPYLIILCLVFLALVIVNAGFKYFINVYRGVLGERILRRMRFQLIDCIMKFPLSRFRSTSQGELVSMVNQETEPLAGFIGESFSLPLYQGGMMMTILVFMFVQDWKLGAAAISLYPLQAWLIPKLQKQVNLLNRERTVRMRNLAENLGETVAGINEIHANDNSEFFKAQYARSLGGLFNTRVKIYRKKFFIKFLNTFIGQITPFLFFLVGGLLVIRGQISVGALVAVIAAYKDLSPPWKELLGWYQRQADSRMKYSLLMDQFDTSNGPLSEQEQVAPAVGEALFKLPLVANNVEYRHPDGTREIDGVSLTIDSGDWVSLAGTGSSGKSTLAHMIARLVSPTKGKIHADSQDVALIDPAVTGKAIGYVGHDSYLFSTSIRENILISLKQKPQDNSLISVSKDDPETLKWLEEARLSGNTALNENIEWVNFDAAGVENDSQLSSQIYSILQIVNLEDDLLRYALARTIDPSEQKELAELIIGARKTFIQRLESQGLHSVVEPHDIDKYNNNSTVAENILFGVATTSEFSVDNLSEHPLIQSLLQEQGLQGAMDEAAVSTAATMVDLVSDLPAGHEFFDRYSFIDADDLPSLKRILGSLDKKNTIDSLKEKDRKLLRSLPYRVIIGRHRLGLFKDDEKDRIVGVRKLLAERLDADSRKKISFFSIDSYEASSSVAENIMFGRIAFGRLGAADRVHRLTIEVLESLKIMPQMIELGLAAPVGLGGSQLPLSQRQKLCLARALIKQPTLLVINEGLNALDAEEKESILLNLKSEYPTISVFHVDNQQRYQDMFDRSIVLEAGKIIKVEELTFINEEGERMPTENRKPVSRQADTILEDEKIALFKNIPIFRLLDGPSLRELANTCDILDVPKGQRLFNQGDAGDALYIIIDGTASILLTRDDRERQLRVCGAEEVIGELALLSHEPRTASVEAMTDLVVLRLKRDAFLDMLQSNGEIGYQILQVMATRLIDMSRRFDNFKSA